MILTLASIGTALLVGFLFGERRAVKQANAILDENWRELMKSIREDRTGFPTDADIEDETARSTLH
jgi:hypothetical protein